jgi:hypothetical protein
VAVVRTARGGGGGGGGACSGATMPLLVRNHTRMKPRTITSVSSSAATASTLTMFGDRMRHSRDASRRNPARILAASASVMRALVNSVFTATLVAFHSPACTWPAHTGVPRRSGWEWEVRGGWWWGGWEGTVQRQSSRQGTVAEGSKGCRGECASPHRGAVP